jgi:hypothetical protein|eukprot:SAG25_NODE_417_length_8250_cov_7.720157_13_plen_79_part_00
MALSLALQAHIPQISWPRKWNEAVYTPLRHWQRTARSGGTIGRSWQGCEMFDRRRSATRLDLDPHFTFHFLRLHGDRW